jgi:hypothetical protein
MSRWLTVGFIVGLHLIAACTATHTAAWDAVALHEKAKELWLRNMTIVDESVDFWKKSVVGSAPYTPKELESAIDFFETVTEMRGRANMSFIGPIPDESLENASREWKAWYVTRGEHLMYDPSKRRVVVGD